MADIQIDTEVFAKALAGALQGAQQKHDLPSGFAESTNYMHGPGGIFSTAGISRDVFSTRVKPRGLLSVLPAFGVTEMNPLVPYLTGFTDYTGSDPEADCDEPPVAGQMKSCLQVAQFGKVQGKTEVIEMNRIGQVNNRGEFTDLRIVNDPLLEQNPFIPDTAGSAATAALNREVLAKFLALGVYFEQRLSKMLYTGSPANNTSGGYAEFPGFEILVGTNKVDAVTGTECPSLDSDVKDFNYGHVDGSDPNIVRYLTYIWRMVNHNAQTMGFNPVEWVWVMRETLFYELTAVWPCNYLTYRCVDFDLDSNVSINISGDEQVRFRDEMRNGQFLMVDGKKVPVIFDDGIPEECGDEGEACFNDNVLDGQFASDIYLIPMTVRGGMPVTFMEYFDYKGVNGAMQAITDGRLSDSFWTDGGRFLWTHSRTNWCVHWLSKIQPRLRFLTPHLAGRLQNVLYTPLQHTRDAFADDPYFVNGGDTSRTATTYYSDWNLPA